MATLKGLKDLLKEMPVHADFIHWLETRKGISSRFDETVWGVVCILALREEWINERQLRAQTVQVARSIPDEELNAEIARRAEARSVLAQAQQAQQEKNGQNQALPGPQLVPDDLKK
jgi:hypothetical protein